jgi:hypothetical protein
MSGAIADLPGSVFTGHAFSTGSSAGGMLRAFPEFVKIETPTIRRIAMTANQHVTAMVVPHDTACESLRFSQ